MLGIDVLLQLCCANSTRKPLEAVVALESVLGLFVLLAVLGGRRFACAVLLVLVALALHGSSASVP